MTFAVDPDDVDAFSTALDDLLWQASSAATYLSTHVSGSGVATGIFAQVDGAMTSLVGELTPNYTSMRTLTGDAAGELRAAATVYRTTDRAAAARLDATY